MFIKIARTDNFTPQHDFAINGSHQEGLWYLENHKHSHASQWQLLGWCRKYAIWNLSPLLSCTMFLHPGFFSPRNVGNYCQLNILLTILRCDNIIYLNISVKKKKNTRILTEWSTTEKDVFWGAECYFICKAYANQLNLNHTIWQKNFCEFCSYIWAVI